MDNHNESDHCWWSGGWSNSGGYKTYQLAIQKQANEDIYENEMVTNNDLFKPV